MAQPLLQAPPSNWEDQFPADTEPAATNWEDQFPEDTPAPTAAASWENQFPTDTETPATNWEDQFPEDKPFFNLADTASAIVDFGRGIVNTTPAALSTLSEGLTRPDKWSEDTLKNLEQDEAFQREMAAKTEQNRAAGTSSSVGESIREAGSSAGFSFGSMAAALPATVAGAYLTRSKLGANLAGGLAGGTAAYRMAGARFLNDSFKDWQTQEEKRLNRPVTETEKEAAYQELLPLAQNAGLWEAGPEAIGNMATLGAGKVILGLGKNKLTNLAKGSLAKIGIKAGAAAGAIGTELATETVTQVGQGLPQAQAEAIAAGQDPATAQSAYPVSVEGVTQAFKDVAPQTLALSGLMMGAAGGVRLATKPFRKSEATPTAPTIEGDLPGTPTATPPTEAQVLVNGTTYGYDTTQLTADQIQTLAATGSLQEYIDQGMVRNVFAPPPLPTTQEATAPDAAAPDRPLVFRPTGPTVAEAQATLGDTGNVGSQFAGASTVGRAGPAPLPRDPEGNYDLLNHLNENPIRAPRKGTEGAAAAEYDWREAGDFDPAFRSRIMQEGAPNIDQRAQEAFDLGFISEPTAQALADEVRSAIAKRNQQRQQGPGQARLLSEQEQAQVQFEQTQERLATTGQPIDLDQLAPGDTLRIDGQPVTVADIDYDEDGYTTRALLRTPTGTVLVTPETNLRADRTLQESSTVPPDLEDLNAQLALAAESSQGFTNTTIVATRQDGSTILFSELVTLATRALQTGTRYATWAANLVRRFGQSIKQYLAEAWQAARKTSQRGTLDIGGNVTRMASDSGAAQNTAPSTGGLTESEVKPFSSILFRGENEGNGTNADKEIGGIHFTSDESYARQYGSIRKALVELNKALDFRTLGKEFTSKQLLGFLKRNGIDTEAKSQQWFSGKTVDDLLSGDRVIEAGEIHQEALDGIGHLIKRAGFDGYMFAELGDFQNPAVVVFSEKSLLSPESSRAETGAGFTNTQVVATRLDGSTVIFAELVDLAGQGIRAGLTLAQWTAAMVQRFGAAVRRFLSEAWQSAKKNSQVGARANLNPNARLTAREPTFAEALEGQTRQSQFGERVQDDTRLTDPLRAAPVSTFAIQGQQQALDQANAIIRQLGLEGATATFQNDATLPMPVRIAGLMQAALQYDARATLALRQGNEAGSAAADAATTAAIEAKASLEFIGNETGRNLAMFNTWARMSPDGQLRRLDRNLAKTAREQIYGDTGVTPAEVTDLVNEETANLDLDAILEEVLTEGNTPTPVNLQTGAPIARNGTIIDRLLGGLETTARAISESTTIQRAVEAIDNVLKALSGKLFADPLLLTPIGQAVLKTTRTLLLQGTKISQAIADAIAVVRTKIPIPPQDVAPLTQAVTSAIVKEVIRPILRKLAFDPNYNKREATKDMLAIGIGVMEAGRLADAVIAKRPKIAKTAQDIVRQRVMRRLSDKPRSKSRKQKLPAIIDTLVLAAGAGFINERTFLDAWDKKYPLPKLTPADRQRLRQMAAAINLLPEGILRQAEAIKFQNEVALIEGIAAVDALTAAWYANLLAGISTQGVNIWGNGLNLFFRTAAVGLASPADVTKLFSGLAAGVRPGLREAKQVLKTGQLLKVNKMDDMQVSGTLELMATQGGPKGFGQWLAYVMSLGGLTRYVFRAMGAMDAVFWYSAQEGMAHLAASRTLRKAGGLKPGTQQFNAEFIRQLGGDETQYLADLDQARTELKAAGVAVTPAAVNRRAWEIRQQRRSLDIRDASVRWADRNVMQQQPEGIGRTITGIITLLQKVRPAGVPIFVPLVPFNRILSNLFESSLDWAGVGILRGLLGSHLTDFNNKDRRLFDTVERRERFMAGMLGMGIAGTLLAAAMALKDMDDDEVPFMVYAMGPPDPTRRGTMPKGWRPYSIKINGQYVSFAESPMGPLLGAVGAWMDSTRYGKTENKTLVDRGLIAFHNGLNSFMSMGVLSSMKDIVELWSGQGGARSLKQAALSPVAGFVPAQGLLRDMAPLFDNTKISDADVFGALVKDIPVLKSYGRPALNVLGEPVKIEGIPVVRRFATGQRPDANIAFIQQHQLRISALPRTIEIGDYLPKRERIAQGLEDSDRRRALGLTAIENGVMTADQQYAFTKAQGEAIKSGLERLRKSTADRPSSPQTTALLQKQLDRTIQAARITAMRQIVSELR